MTTIIVKNKIAVFPVQSAIQNAIANMEAEMKRCDALCHADAKQSPGNKEYFAGLTAEYRLAIAELRGLSVASQVQS